MSKVRCGGCHEYIEKDTALRRGLQNFCQFACIKWPKQKEPKSDISDQLRLKVHQDDNWGCRRCGTQHAPLDIHHIKYRSTLGEHTYENLISVCRSCHQQIHEAPREVYQPLLYEIVALREQGDRVTRVVDIMRRRN